MDNQRIVLFILTSELTYGVAFYSKFSLSVDFTYAGIIAISVGTWSMLNLSC